MAKSHAQSDAVDEIVRSCLATRMCRLNRLVGGIYDRALRPIGLTASQMGVLVGLAQADGMRPAEICQALQMDKSTLSRHVQRMQRQGWVQTTATDDARSHRLEVTEIGLGLIEQALPLWHGAQARAREVLGGAAADRLFKAVDSPSFGEDLADQAGGDSGVRRRPIVTSAQGKGAEPLATPRSAMPLPGRPKEPAIFFWE